MLDNSAYFSLGGIADLRDFDRFGYFSPKAHLTSFLDLLEFAQFSG